MINTNIANIKIAFNYRFSDFFEHNIEHYKTDEPSIHLLETKYYTSDIKIIDGVNNRILAGVDGNIKTLLTYDAAFKHAMIHIDERKFRKETLPHAEYIYMSMVFLEISYLYQYFPMHGSAIAYKNQGLIVSAPSGTGKSTHTRMWKEAFNDDVIYVNDDKPLLKLIDDDIYIFGTPFSGAHTKNTNIRIPLKALVFLNQGLTNDIRPTNKDEAIKKIMRNSLRPKESHEWDEVIRLIDKMIEKVQMIDIDATLSHEAVYAVRKAIFKE